MLSGTIPNPLKLFTEICNILGIYVLCIEYSPRFIVMPCHVISALKNTQLMWYVHQGFHYMQSQKSRSYIYTWHSLLTGRERLTYSSDIFPSPCWSRVTSRHRGIWSSYEGTRTFYITLHTYINRAVHSLIVVACVWNVWVQEDEF